MRQTRTTIRARGCCGFRGPSPRPRGMVIIVVLVVVASLSLGALAFSELMLTEHRAAWIAAQQAQARALADSGVDVARVFLTWDEQTQYESGGWYDNPDLFRGFLAKADDQGAGRFSFIAPLMAEGGYVGVRYGLENESAKLNLNVLLKFEELAGGDPEQNPARQMLMGLPGMTEDTADAILDYMDADDDLRDYGAEREYYEMLETPYAPKNGYLDTIEELLLVRGVTPTLLFGVDANHNGYADAGEADPLSMVDVDNSDGSMDRGWAAYLTIYSLETNLRSDGSPKIDINQDDDEQLRTEMEEALLALDLDEEMVSQWIEFILAYRQYGPYQDEDEAEDGAGSAPATSSGGQGGTSGGGQTSSGSASSGGTSGGGVGVVITATPSGGSGGVAYDLEVRGGGSGDQNIRLEIADDGGNATLQVETTNPSAGSGGSGGSGSFGGAGGSGGSGDSNQQGGGSESGEDDSGGGRHKIESILDLIG
ncbi:MAG: type II secretion system minor pseudopilin, partial [Planctomycetota bacterium]